MTDTDDLADKLIERAVVRLRDIAAGHRERAGNYGPNDRGVDNPAPIFKRLLKEAALADDEASAILTTLRQARRVREARFVRRVSLLFLSDEDGEGDQNDAIETLDNLIRLARHALNAEGE